MANELDSIVSVTIDTDSTQPARAGFGVPLLLTYHTRFAEQYREYSSLFEMATDGFTTVDEAYRKARAIFAQNPTVPSIVVGRLPTAPAFRTELTVLTAVEGAHVKLKVVMPVAGTLTDPVVTGGVISPTGALLAGQVVSIDYTVQAAATLTTVAAALETLIEAIPGVDSTASVAVIIATPTTAGRKIHAYDLTNVAMADITIAAGYDTELDSLQIVNDSWYFLGVDSTSEANIDAVAVWTLAQKKLFFANVHDTAALAGTSTIGSDLKTAGNDRTVLLYSANSHEMAAEAWVGKGAPSTPGSITWSLKTLTGVTPSSLTTTQRSNLVADGINYYTTVAGINVVRDGYVAMGEFIDIIHGIDALQSDIQISVYALLAGSDKVPFTASGLDLVANAILGALKRFEGSIEQPGLIAIGTSRVIMPLLSTISTSDKAARRLSNVRFSGNLAGAVHFVEIVGVLSL